MAGRGQSAAAWPRPPDLATCVCICVLICPNLMRDRLAQTSLPLLRFAVPPACARWTSPGLATGRVSTLKNWIAKLRHRGGVFAVRRSLMKLAGNAGLFAALAGVIMPY